MSNTHHLPDPIGTLDTDSRSNVDTDADITKLSTIWAAKWKQSWNIKSFLVSPIASLSPVTLSVTLFQITATDYIFYLFIATTVPIVAKPNSSVKKLETSVRVFGRYSSIETWNQHDIPLRSIFASETAFFQFETSFSFVSTIYLELFFIWVVTKIGFHVAKSLHFLNQPIRDW